MSNYNIAPTLDGLNNLSSNNIDTENLEVDTLTILTSGTAPTRSTNDNTNHIATTAFVQNNISGLGTNYVTTNTNQTISGEKTFSNSNTYVSGELKATNYTSNKLVLDNNTYGTHTMQLYGKNISALSDQSIEFQASTGYTFFTGVGNVYFKNTTGGTKLVQIVDVSNVPLDLQSTSGTNTIRSYGNLNIFTLSASPLSINSAGQLTLDGSNLSIGSNISTSQTTTMRSKTLNLNTDAPNPNTIEIGNNNSSLYVNANTTFDNTITANFSIINQDVASFQNGAFFDNVCPLSNVAPTSSNDLTRKSYVDNNFVSLSGTQTITGSKLFNTVCPQSSVPPSNTNDLTNYGWVNTNISNNMNPTGTIIMFPSATAPAGYLLCDGTTYNTTAYASLWSVIFYTYGGSGNNFKVPNFQGCFLRGAGSQVIGGETYTAGALGTPQQDQVLQTTVYATNEGFRDCGSGTRSCVARSRITGDPVDTNTGILPQFQRQGTENRPVNHSIYYYIKYL